MRPFLAVLIIFTVLFTACQHLNTEREKLYTEVMNIHDDVMPEMSTIHRLRKNLKAIDTSLVKTPSYPIILNHLSALEKADDGMMSWMAEFSNPTSETDEVTALAYLKKEKIRISEVRDQMLESIAAARKILHKAENSSKIDTTSLK